jgi:hypothetical protein
MPLIKLTASKALRTDKNKRTRSDVAKALSEPQGRQMPKNRAKKKIQPTFRAPSCMIFTIHQLSRSAKPVGSPQGEARDMSKAVLSQTRNAINKTTLTMA